MTRVTNGMMPATPVDYTKDDPDCNGYDGSIPDGLSKREYMATAIIQGMFAQYDHLGSEVDAAERAVLVADALLAALGES